MNESTLAIEPRAAIRPALIAAAALVALLVGLGTRDDGPGRGGRAASAPAAASLAFEPNRGRMPASVDYVARAGHGAVALTDRGATFSRSPGEWVRMTLPGATLDAPTAGGRLDGVVNDLRGSDPEGWRSGLPTFGRVLYASAYPGIDLVYNGAGGRLEYDFHVAAGADPGAIRLAFPGARTVRSMPGGGIAITRDGTTLRQSPPVAFQNLAGERVAVESAFRVDGTRVRFELGAYDRDLPLVIDPVVYDYSTYLGGSDTDDLNTIDVDGGSAYVAGGSYSSDFNSVGAIEGDDDGRDVVISKLNAAGDGLVFSTYLGGDDYDVATAIAIGPSGGVYVAGQTNSSDFNTVGPIEGNSIGADIFVSKLNPAGSALTYSTYLGGDSGDYVEDIAVDANGSAYIAGSTYSTDYDLEGEIQTDGASQDGFVSKLTPAGDALVYSTYLGGGAADGAESIDVRGGAAYVAGFTDSTDFTVEEELEGDSPLRDAFVSRLNAAGSALTYSTYLGGSSYDEARGIDVTADGSMYVAGSSESSDFDLVNPVEGFTGPVNFDDVFVSKLDPAGDAIVYSTLLGGNDNDEASAVSVGSDGSASIAGTTESTDFDTVGELQGDQADTDGFAFTLSPSGGSLAFSTYLGGSDEDELEDAAAVGGSLYVTGTTSSSDYPRVGGIEGDDSDSDGFVTKLGVAPYLETTIDSGPAEGSTVAERNQTIGFSSSGAPTAFQCSVDGAAAAACNSPLTLTQLGDGAHTVEVRALGGRLTDPTPATRSFSVDATAPETSITKAPKGKKLKLKKGKKKLEVKLKFEADDPGASYECRFDDGDYKPCDSPKRKKLKKGKHTFRVRAIDALGNVETEAAKVTLKVKKPKR